MSAPSPVLTGGELVTISITADGKALDSAYQVVSVDIWTGVNKLPRARLVISDGDPHLATFPISETKTLIPGSPLKIALGYDGKSSEVFSGLIYQQGLEISNDGASRLIVDATDKATVMTLARKSAIFENTTDSKVISKLIGDAGLEAKVSATTPQQPSVVQYYCSDWDLMLTRAQLNGMLVIASAGKIVVAPPDTSASPVLTLAYGLSLLEFHAEMDATTQYRASAIHSYAWDPATQAVAGSAAGSSTVSAPGNLSFDQLAQVFGVSDYVQQTGASLAKADLTAWTSAELTKSRLAKIRGEALFQGSALAAPGVMVTLEGLGSRFNGDAYVSAVQHSVSDGFWSTRATIGMAPEWFTERAPAVNAPPASGQLAAMANVQTGVVLKLDGDPAGEFRVQVSLPLLQAGKLGLWARLASFYASKEFGAMFYPEVGDEVLLAFMNGDPRFPVILGAVYSKKLPPPALPSAANNLKSIVTRSKLRIDFDDKQNAISIETPDQHSIRLDDKADQLVIKDKHGNTITLAGNSIEIKGAGSIAIKAQQDLSLSATGKLTLKGSGGVSIAGATIDAKADASFAAQGGASAKLSSSAMVTVQGALVKIN
ncbi:type VI secretion system tip protein VgrG [Duganella sp. sic0402]|uniref:type VI secretion system tip protein VgrG n=1 Tax=Duganella sp. sic0402 TaxID=2854786 RepID=UPI001C4975B4|nr:type VI secretion system tip protein VgrG [Duganella sp. sic0402]MBV7534714.1 type VI secretion system tip protein VgrG [Duganella sp. sic0402]